MRRHLLCAGICTVRWRKAHSLPIFYTAFVVWGRMKPKGIGDQSVKCKRDSAVAVSLGSLTTAGEMKER